MTSGPVAEAAPAAKPKRANGGHLRAVDGNEPPDERPLIRIESAHAGNMVRETIEVFTSDPDIYQRGGELVTITHEPEHPYDVDARHGRDMVIQPGAPRIRTLTLAGARIRSAEGARWEKYVSKKGEEGWYECGPDVPTVQAALDPTAFGGWPTIRLILGVRECPFLTPSGEIIQAPGYNGETGYVLLPSIDVGKIDSRPTQAQAQAALKYLWTELFCDFPFAGMGESQNTRDPAAASARYDIARSCPDAFVAIAALLAIVARPAIRGACMSSAFEANTQGVGKTKQAHLVSVVATGRPAGTAAFPTTHDEKTNDEEMSKMLGGYARAGVPIVTFDNVRGEIGGGALEGVMTAVDSAPFRLLGTNDIVRLPWSSVLLFSGNNMQMSDDVAQRMLLSRLESPREDPRSRPAAEYRHPNVIEWATENRAMLVRACLVILRAFMVADGRPDVGTVGSFEAWAGVVPAAIVYAGGPNIIGARPKPEATGGDVAGAHRTILETWPDQFMGGVKLGPLIRFAFEHERAIEHGTEAPDGLDDFRMGVRALTNTPDGAQPTARGLGNALRAVRGKWRGERRLDTSLDRNGISLWRVTVRGEAPPLPAQPALPGTTDPAEDFERE